MKIKLGPVIRRLRESAKLNQDELAHRVGTDKGNISRIETKNQVPELDRLAAIASVLNVPLSAIFAEVETGAPATPALTPVEAALVDDFNYLLPDQREEVLRDVAQKAEAGRSYAALFGVNHADDARVAKALPRTPKHRVPRKQP